MSPEDRFREALSRALADACARLEPELTTIAGELREARTAALATAAEALDGSDEAALSQVRADHATTFPLTVGGSIVAVLYVETGAVHDGHVRALELLTRYAGRLLESRTLHLALGMAAR